ncbi:MAG: uracil-DNA glycosylase [Polyangiales bacterium]
MSDDPRRELADLAAMAREWLVWEDELGGHGFRVLEAAREGRSTSPGTIRAESRIDASSAVGPPERPRDVASPPPGEPLAAQASPPAFVPAVDRGGPARDETSLRASLTVIAERAAACQGCRLHETRTNSVFARGNPLADVAFVGEGPGFHEDQQGVPFVGPAGQLLDRMIAAMGYHPDDVYVCNVVKCRPPDNRTPLPDEALACSPFLAEQLRLVAPKAIVALGRCAAENLGVMPEGGKGWRGSWGKWNGIPVMPTYHPAFLLRSPQFKRQVWDDLQRVMAHLGRPSRG